MSDRAAEDGFGTRDASPQDSASSGYAPYGLILDDARLGLVTTTVRSDLGSCVAHHRPGSTSDVATIFLHGASGAWTTWTPLLQAAEAAGIALENPVLLDLPGWGDARITTDQGDVTVRAISTLVQQVAERLGYTRWHLVGHSLGGFVAMHMASIWPQSVLSVRMVSGTTFSVIASVDQPFRGLVRLPAFTLLWQAMRFLVLLGAAGPALVRGIDRAGFGRPLFSPLFRHWRAVPRSLIVATAHDVRPRAFSAAAEVARGYDAKAQWSGIRCPVWATKGDRDVFVTDADLVELASVLPQCTTEVIPDCGHFGIVERPVEVLAALGFTGATP